MLLFYFRYMQFFPEEAEVKFEKSATYFEKDVVPKQMHALLPTAKIIIILADPILRAHSWYHVSVRVLSHVTRVILAHEKTY